MIKRPTVIDVAASLQKLSEAEARDRSLPARLLQELPPYIYGKLCSYAREMSESMLVPRARGRLHVSDACSPQAWECLRWTVLRLQGERGEKPIDDNLVRIFWMGDHLHLTVLPKVAISLPLLYGDRFEWIDIHLEQRTGTPNEEGGLPGTPDIFLEFLLDGQLYGVVVDLKSTSESQHQKRKMSSTRKGVRVREILVEAHYRRQVDVYATRVGAHYALMLYWIKAYPHLFEQTVVWPDPRTTEVIDRTRRDAEEYINAGRLPNVSVGSWCGECEFVERCHGGRKLC